MTNFLKDITTPRGRHWLYRVAIAVIALMTALGWVTQDMEPFIVAVVAAVLSISVADGNVNEEEEYFEDEYEGYTDEQVEESVERLNELTVEIPISELQPTRMGRHGIIREVDANAEDTSANS